MCHVNHTMCAYFQFLEGDHISQDVRKCMNCTQTFKNSLALSKHLQKHIKILKRKR